MSKLARSVILAALVVLAVGVPGAGRATTTDVTLNAVVGDPAVPDAFKITLTDSSGAKVSHLPAGTYTIVIKDYATLHDFHLTGPGVDQSTDITGTGTTTWTVTIGNGTYRYFCDAHPTTMRQTFTGGVVPPAPVKLTGAVGPGPKISLRRGSANVKSLAAGAYKLTVRDASATDNFHFSGPGVNRRTSIRGRGSSTWSLRLSSGRYRYFSDAHKRLAGSFSVS